MKILYIFYILLLLNPLYVCAVDFNEVEELINKGEYQKSINKLSTISNKIKKKDKHLYYYYNGKINYKLNDYKKAISYYNKAIKLKPKWAICYNEISLAYYKLNNNKEAIGSLKKAIKFDKILTIAYYNLGNRYLDDKKNKLAITAYKIVFKYEKDIKLISKAYLGIGNAYQAENQLSDSIESFKKAVEIDNSNWKAYMNLGLVYFSQDLLSEAINEFKKVIELKNDYHLAYFYLGNCYRGQQEYNKMENNYKICLKYKPKFVDALHSLASYHAFKENKKLMINYLKILFSVDEEYKNIIIRDNLFKKYKNDDDFLELVKGGNSGR